MRSRTRNMWNIVRLKRRNMYLCDRRISHWTLKKVALCLMLFYFTSLMIFAFNHKTEPTLPSIGILVVVNDDIPYRYDQHIAGLTCYAYRNGYQFTSVNTKQYPICLNMSRCIYFQKHCIVSMYLLEHFYIQWLLVLDIDVLVLNMSKKIESYLPNPDTGSSIHMILYERFNGEIMAGNYIIRNHFWSHRFILRWLDYEHRISHIPFHNSDNGALHMLLLSDMVGDVTESQYNYCFGIYEKVNEPSLYHTYIGCCKCTLNGRFEFEHLRILRRGHSFVRDNLGHDMKKHILSPTDFLIHGQKNNFSEYYSEEFDSYKCRNPLWKLPLKEEAVITDYTEVKERIRKYDREAAQAYPYSVGFPDISECWPHCTDSEARRLAFVEKVCNKKV